MNNETKETVVTEEMATINAVVNCITRIIERGFGNSVYQPNTAFAKSYGYVIKGRAFMGMTVSYGGSVLGFDGEEKAIEILNQRPVVFEAQILSNGERICKVLKSEKAPIVDVPTEYTPPDKISDVLDRVVVLARDLRPEEIYSRTISRVDFGVRGGRKCGECPKDYSALERYKGTYHHFESYFGGINDGWCSREIPGPEISSLNLCWGYKKGQFLVVKTEERHYGNGTDGPWSLEIICKKP